MDANLQRPHQLADERDWAFTNTRWDAQSRMVRLAGSRTPAWTEDATAGEARVAHPPGSIDRFDTSARVERTETTPGSPRWSVIARGGAPGTTTIFGPTTTEISDIVIGRDDVLYLAHGDRVRLHDLRGRWDDAEVVVPGGAWRLAAGPRGVYVLGAHAPGTTVGRIVGLPMRPRPFVPDPGTFRPHPEDADPPRFEALATLPPGVTPAAIATSELGRIAVIAWSATGPAVVHLVGEGGRFEAALPLAGTTRPYSAAWLDEHRIAVLIATDKTVVGVYDLAGGVASLAGELFPLRDPTGEPFLHGTLTPPRYPSAGGSARSLVPVSWPSFVETGEVAAVASIDSRVTATTWHRIYLEAAIPAGTSVTVLLAANDTGVTPAATGEWFEHRFGALQAPTADVPNGVWVDARSEIPFHEALLPCPPRPHTAGLFTVLVQRAGRRTRALAGRYLFVRVVLAGDGRSTPELAALRVYANRRGYAGLYLPELYRETVFGTDADAAHDATPADFLDRFLGTFESFLTPLEDRIASAWLLTHPKVVPADALDWLASWLGFVFAADLPLRARRAMLENAWHLYQRRGTLVGLKLALELATLTDDDDTGAISRGEIVVIEDFRLRRTFATILGANFTDAGDPLLPGLIISGNSHVGDTLFVGEESNRDFLALFAPSDRIDEDDIQEFFDRLAHRVTVLVHQEVREQDLGLIRQIVELEAPAHVEVKIITANHRFRVAVSSLVGVDTFSAPEPPPTPVLLDRSFVGVHDVIERLPSLDPRLGRTS